MPKESIYPKGKSIKIRLAESILWFLGRGFEAASKQDTIIRQEIAPWPENTTVMMKVDPYGPFMAMKKQNGSLVYLGAKEVQADCAVHFKNIDAALLLLTAQMGISQAFVEHRLYMKGDLIGLGMPMVRSLYRVEAYLFPEFIAKKILKRMPQKHVSSARIYIGTLFRI